MRRRIAFSVFVCTIAVAGAWIVLVPSVPRFDYLTAAYLFVALSIVGALDVWLPRGDYSDVGGAFVFASGLLLAPPLAIGVVVSSRVLVWATRKPRESMWQVLDDVARRVAQTTWALVLFWLIGGTTPVSGSGPGLTWRVLVSAVLFFLLEFVVAQLGSSVRLETPFWPLVAGNIQLQGWMTAAQLSAAMLAAITYSSMGGLSIVIVAGLLLVMRQSFALLVEVRHAFRSTVEALARSIEAHDSTRRGHAERVAALSTEVGRILGLHGKQLEALTYAALFHDVGLLATDAGGPQGSAGVLQNVGTLSSSVPILRIIDERGKVAESQEEHDLVGAYVVSRMSEYDDRGKKVGLTDDAATADAIGARLYASTREEVDRAIRRAERRAEAGRLQAAQGPVGGIAW